MPPDSLVSVRGVSRLYGEKLIFRNLDLELLPGRIYLLSGANGAGKSTLLRLLAGLARPDTGKIIRRENINMAYLGHGTFLYPALTALQNLRFWAKANAAEADTATLMQALGRTGLEAHANEKAGDFSRGMAQRLNFARCLMLDPDLMLLDEPFTGMDFQTQALLRPELARRRDNGACIVLVSHAREADGCLADEFLTIASRRLRESAGC